MMEGPVAGRGRTVVDKQEKPGSGSAVSSLSVAGQTTRLSVPLFSHC